MDTELFAIVVLCIFYIIDKYRLVKLRKRLKSMEDLLYQQMNNDLAIQDNFNTDPVK